MGPAVRMMYEIRRWLSARDRDIGQVCDPELIRTCQRDILSQVREYRQIMGTVGRCHIPPPSPRLKVMFAYQALDALVMHRFPDAEGGPVPGASHKPRTHHRSR